MFKRFVALLTVFIFTEQLLFAEPIIQPRIPPQPERAVDAPNPDPEPNHIPAEDFFAPNPLVVAAPDNGELNICATEICQIDQLGRIIRITYSDGTYVLISYWFDSTYKKKEERHSENGALTDTVEFYEDGLTRLLSGDLNRDGSVNRQDMAVFVSHFGTQASATWSDGDFDRDGLVSLSDLGLLQQNFGSTVSARTFYASGNLESIFFTQSSITVWFRDEDFYANNRGRFARIIHADTSKTIYDRYWERTDHIKTSREYDASGNLEGKTYDMDSSLIHVTNVHMAGNLENILDRSSFNLLLSENGDLVWSSHPGSYYQTFLYDGSEIRQISNNGFEALNPDINASGQAVWYEYNSQSDGEIFLWNGQATIQLSDNSFGDELPQISDNGDVVWVGLSPPYGPNIESRDIFLYEAATGQIRALTDNLHNDERPKINSRGDVVWYGGVNYGGNNEIFLYDAATRTISQLTHNSYYDVTPQISDNGNVVWYGWDGNDEEVFLYNGVDVVQLTNNSSRDFDPQIDANGNVTWRNNFGDRFFYDGISIIQLTDNTDLDYTPQSIAHDNAISVWEWNSQIFFYDGFSVTQLSDDRYVKSDPEINDNGEIIWSGYLPLTDEVIIFRVKLDTFSTNASPAAIKEPVPADARVKEKNALEITPILKNALEKRYVIKRNKTLYQPEIRVLRVKRPARKRNNTPAR